MKEWLDDAIEQICLGDLLVDANVAFGRRFALIAIDNSVEYALICYVEIYKSFVGKPDSGGITRADWLQTKRFFGKLLAYVVSKEPKLASYQDEINRYHGIRDDLYHTGTPMTVSDSVVTRYSSIAKELLNILFTLNFGKSEWDDVLGKVKNALTTKAADLNLKAVVVFERINNVVKYSTSSVPKTPMAIMLILHGYNLLEGREPTQEELVRSLMVSGLPTPKDAIYSRLWELRNKDMIYAGKFMLKEKGRKTISDQYNVQIR